MMAASNDPVRTRPLPKRAARTRDARNPRRAAIQALYFLGAWLVVGTVGFVTLADYPLIDAIYMTVITITTVGYEEVHPLSPAARLYVSAYIIVGISTFLYALTRFGQVIIEGELKDIIGRRRAMRELATISDHYILCGFGRAARAVVHGFQRESVAFCIVERDASLEPQLRATGALFVIGDATDDAVLETAGLARARGVLALLPSDAENLYLTMTAKVANPTARVIARASDERAEAKLARGGADFVISPNRMTGERVVHAVTRPNLLEFIELVAAPGGLALRIEEIRIEPGSDLAASTIEDAEIRRRAGAIVIALKKEGGKTTYNPGSGTLLAGGDIILVLGRDEDLRRLELIARSPNP